MSDPVRWATLDGKRSVWIDPGMNPNTDPQYRQHGVWVMSMAQGKPSRHNRAPLPAEEEARLETLNEKILAALREGPKTNKAMSRIALDYGRRIRDLRAEGRHIVRRRIEGGLNEYTLRDEAEPIWHVRVRVIFLDGSGEREVVVPVRALNEGLARNRAQHLATKVKVLSAVRGGDYGSGSPVDRVPEREPATGV